jgi:hypothetical protein
MPERAISVELAIATLPTLAQTCACTLHAENKAMRTIRTYVKALRLFGEYWQRQGMPIAVAHVRREHVECFVAG